VHAGFLDRQRRVVAHWIPAFAPLSRRFRGDDKALASARPGASVGEPFDHQIEQFAHASEASQIAVITDESVSSWRRFVEL
jgi:hypothetical protein